MNFLNPIGLLALIAIPVVLLIYVIKNRYSEFTVSSTYIWRLSEQYLKRKNPFTFMNGLLSLILQLLIVAVLGFTVADPIFRIPNSAKNYLFVLDTSASMQFEEDGVSRFEKAKAEIGEIVKNSKNGSVYSLCVAGETADITVLRSEDKNAVYQALEKATVSSCSFGVDDAIRTAQSMFDEDPSLTVFVATDTAYTETFNLEVIDLARSEKNVSLVDAKRKYVDEKLQFTVSLHSYEDTEVEVSLKIDEQDEIVQSVSLKEEKIAALVFDTEATSFTQATFTLKNADGLSRDNEIVLYSREEENEVKVLLVSDQPFYLASALRAVPSVSLDIVGQKAIKEAKGYDLYVFDGGMPVSMPKDGAVWFVGQKGNIADAGFISQNKNDLSAAGYLEYSNSATPTYKAITSSLRGTPIALSQYYGYSYTKEFETVLTYGDDPVLTVGTTPYAFKEVVFHFDLHKSNLPLLYDYVVLIDNLVEFSSPSVLSDNLYAAGDTVSVNLPNGIQSAKLVAPSGAEEYLGNTAGLNEVRITEVGGYSLVLQGEDESSVYHFYSLFPTDEADPSVKENRLALNGEGGDGSLAAVYHDLTWFVAALVLLITIDWGVYVYEQRKYY